MGQEAIGMYLDNSALIDIGEALDGTWSSALPADPRDRRHLAAARVALYGHDERGWNLCSSSAAREEHLRGVALAWLDVLIIEVFGTDETGAHQKSFEAAGVDPADALHCAIAASHSWIRYFVTDDQKVLDRAPSVDLPRRLEFVSVEAAETLLEIEAGETPLTTPADSNPLSKRTPWWIPGSSEQ